MFRYEMFETGGKLALEVQWCWMVPAKVQRRLLLVRPRLGRV